MWSTPISQGVDVTGRNRAHVVEVEPSGICWIKSSASSGAESNCVQIASVGNVILVRNSRDRSGPRLAIPVRSWAAFLAH
ncbi:MAG TPA: DUF397 domain-containing protein [Pseudonocardiaceae bacterium]